MVTQLVIQQCVLYLSVIPHRQRHRCNGCRLDSRFRRRVVNCTCHFILPCTTSTLVVVDLSPVDAANAFREKLDSVCVSRRSSGDAVRSNGFAATLMELVERNNRVWAEWSVGSVALRVLLVGPFCVGQMHFTER